MNKPIVGVKLPVSGVGAIVLIGVTVVSGVIVGTVVAAAVGAVVTRGVADGVDSKAGPSAA